MKCPHCDFERPEAFAFCPKCGKPSTREIEPVVVCPTPRILGFIKDNLFLAVCILLTAGLGISMLSGGFDVLKLLITIFSWLTYAGGRKNIVEHKHIRVISGSVYALYVIENILAVFIALMGVIYSAVMLGLPFLSGINLDEFITDKLGPMLTLSSAVLALVSAVAMFLGGILIVMSIIMLILNVAGLKKIHRLIQSIYKSGEAGEENFVGANKVQPWLIVFAVILIIDAVVSMSNGNVLDFLSEGCFTATLIICNILVGKHLCDK